MSNRSLLLLIAGVIASPACIRSIDEIPKPGEGVVIQGTVVERSLATTELTPVHNASVRVKGSSARRTTDDRGFFSLERLPLGLHQIQVERRGADGRAASARLLEPVSALFGGQSINLGTIELRGTGSLAGVVRYRSETGTIAPGAGALVVAAETGFKAIAGEDGAWVLAGLPESTVDVVAFQAGYAPARALHVNVAPGTEARVRELVLQKTDQLPLVVLSGRARLSDAVDASGISVALIDANVEGASSRDATTLSDGGYRFEDIPVGIYRVKFAKTGYSPVVLESVAVLPEGALGLRPVLLVPSAAGDLDGDGIADGDDDDRDGDGCANASDQFPEDDAYCHDNDDDSLADEIDLDDDGDGLSDAEEAGFGRDGFVTDPFSTDTDSDGVSDPSDPCPTVPNEDVGLDVDEDGVPDACDLVDDRGGGGVVNPPDPPPPELTGFTPLEGPAGTLVTVTGRYFRAEQLAFNAVRFGANGPIAGADSVTTTEMRVRVPEGVDPDPSGVRLLVYTGGRVLTSTPAFVFKPAPEVLAFAPRAGRPGTIVSVYGRHFDHPMLAAFIGPEAGTIEDFAAGRRVGTAVIDGELVDAVRVRIPQNAQSGAISIVTQYGTSASARLYNVINNLAVLQASPPSGPVGTDVLLRGAGFSLDGFVGMVTVEFVGAAPVAPHAGFTDTSMIVTVPAGAMTGPITVHHPSGDATSPFAFVTDPAQPYILDMRPTLARVGENIRLTGGNLSGATDVLFGGVAAGAGEIVTNNAGLVEVRVPAGAVPGAVDVVFGGGVQVRSPRLLALLERTNVLNPADVYGPGFSADGSQIYAVLRNFGAIFDATTLAEITMPSMRPPLSFLPGGIIANGFKVAPSGTVGILIGTNNTTYIVDLPSFGLRGSCPPNQTYTTSPFEYKFDALSRFAFAPRPMGFPSTDDAVVRVDLLAGTCEVLPLGMIMNAAPIGGILPALDPAELILAHPNLGMATIDIDPTSPTEGEYTSPFGGTGVSSGVLVWGPGFTSIWSVSNGLTRYRPFSSDPPFTIPGNALPAIQSDNLRWIFKGDAIIDLAFAETVRTGETLTGNTVFGGGARGTAIVIPGTSAQGLVRYTIRE